MRMTRKHGLSRTAEYRAWQTMRLRCTDPNNAAWPNYGGRGITVCDRWIESPENFIADMGAKPSPRHELDRKDNGKGYEPANCRWVLRPVNCRNRRSSRTVEHNCQALTVAEWAERTGLSRSIIQKRLDAGWTPAAALDTAARQKAPTGHAKPAKHPCADCGAPTTGTRCRSCDNRHRAALRRAA